ncbi:da59e35e-0929-4bb4-a766-8578070a362c [Thermothielavioides terrestris]|uniref:Da59e35e-0929-4bb4-a766-8578070a362c n=1 Tax=Thermothielavioides terrestris TaxID=2587410 RepID=A0A446BKN1_9PEZI|nr:da59e35e-0929-4bb4-a766-8578070a362c [Thermothielavioides terrestris]
MATHPSPESPRDANTATIQHDSDTGTRRSDLEEKPAPARPLAPSAAAPDSPPDGGLVAWLQVVGGFLIYFSTWGLISAFPVFQAYYESGALFEASSSNISWIGSIQCFLLQLTGVLSGPIYDRGYMRALLLAGSILIVLGLMMLSLCTQYWQALLSQALCIGIGAGLLFVPTVSLIPTWFSTRVGLAVGIAASGSSIGGVVYPVVLSRLLAQVGFAWAVRAVGFVALATFAVPLAALRMRAGARAAKPRAAVDWSAFRDGPFMLFTLAVFLVFVGQTVLLFYVSFYPADRGLTGTSLAFYNAAVFNAASTLGRILPNALSDRIGVFNTLAPLSLLLGATLFCLLAVRNAAGVVVIAVVTGFTSGVVIALPPVCFRLLTANKAMIGTRVGQGYAMVSFALLLGGPSAGAILGSAGQRNWTGLWVIHPVSTPASTMLLSTVLTLAAVSLAPALAAPDRPPLGGCTADIPCQPGTYCCSSTDLVDQIWVCNALGRWVKSAQCNPWCCSTTFEPVSSLYCVC